VATLLLRVPVTLAVAHQTNALALLTVVLVLCHGLRAPAPGARHA
jgi:heme a synthase